MHPTKQEEAQHGLPKARILRAFRRPTCRSCRLLGHPHRTCHDKVPEARQSVATPRRTQCTLRLKCTQRDRKASIRRSICLHTRQVFLRSKASETYPNLLRTSRPAAAQLLWTLIILSTCSSCKVSLLSNSLRY